MKKANNNGGGTSFHGTRIKCTPNELLAVAKKLGMEPGEDFWDENCGRDKTNFDFTFQTDEDDIFTVYDWKHYKPLRMDERYDFHIGGLSLSATQQGKLQLFEEILKLR